MAFATATADLQHFEKMYALTKLQANASEGVDKRSISPIENGHLPAALRKT